MLKQRFTIKTSAISIFYLLIWLSGGFFIGYLVRGKSQKVIGLHNVMPDQILLSGISDYLTMSVTDFSRMINHIKKRLPITTDVGARDTALLTFDDGVKNNFEVVFPILEKAAVGAYFFVPLSVAVSQRVTYIDRIFMWADFAPAGVHQVPREIGLSGASEILLDTTDSRFEAAQKLAKAAKKNEASRRAIEGWIDAVEPDLRARCGDSYHRLRFTAMSTEDLARLKNRGHFVGAHSVNHAQLSLLSDDALQRDFEQCASAIDNSYNTRIYCYPFGGPNDVSSMAASCCQATGFEAAFLNVSVVPGHLREHGAYALPRISIPPHAPSWVIDAKLTGFDSLLRSIFGSQ